MRAKPPPPLSAEGGERGGGGAEIGVQPRKKNHYIPCAPGGKRKEEPGKISGTMDGLSHLGGKKKEKKPSRPLNLLGGGGGGVRVIKLSLVSILSGGNTSILIPLFQTYSSQTPPLGRGEKRRGREVSRGDAVPTISHLSDEGKQKGGGRRWRGFVFLEAPAVSTAGREGRNEGAFYSFYFFLWCLLFHDEGGEKKGGGGTSSFSSDGFVRAPGSEGERGGEKKKERDNVAQLFYEEGSFRV